MKRKQLLFFSLAVVFSCIVKVHAVNVPYIQSMQSFGGVSADLATFTPIPGDYTLEVQGAVGTQISIAGGVINYTPTTNPVVRFVQKKGVVYVYEGLTYMTSINPDYSSIFPAITDANMTTDANVVLQNASFETAGSLVGGTNYNFGAPWVSNVTVASSGGIRVTNGTAGNVNGTYECIWRGTGNSNYFAQPISAEIQSNTFYKVVLNQIAGSNSVALFNVGLGSTVDGLEYASKTFLLGNGKNGQQSLVLGAPSNLSGTTYFTFKNTAANTATAGSQTDALTQLDYVQLVKGTFATTGISNVTSATFLSGTAYAPEISLDFAAGDSYDMTSYIANRGFDNLKGEWTETPSGNTGGYSFSEVEYYSKTFNISQSISNLPAGIYKLKASGFERAAANDAGAAYNANTEVIQSKLYATSSAGSYSKAFNSLYSNAYQTAWGGTQASNFINNMAAANGAFTADYYDMQLENIKVGADGVLTIGAKKETNVSNSWTLFDNFRLYYYGIVKTDLKALMDSATVMKNDPQSVGTSTVYADLETAIATAQVVYNNANASAAEVVEQESAMKLAISNVYGAILLQSRKNAWTSLPMDVTSVVVNPSFESDLSVGWTNPNGIVRQSNTSLGAFKEGTNYAEKWMASPGTQMNLKISQEIKNIPNGIYKITAAAQGIQQTATATYPGGAYVYGNTDSTEVFALNDYAVQVKVTNNTLTLGFKVDTTGNWIAVDNFRLSYISDGSPYLLTSQPTVTFAPSVTVDTIKISGGNLTSDISVSTSSSFTLSKSSFTAAEVSAEGGAELIISHIGNAPIASDSVVFMHGAAKAVVKLAVVETISPSTKGLFYDQSLLDTTNITISGDLFNDIQISAPAGIKLSENFISKADAKAGKMITARWEYTRIENQFVYLTSGTKKDSILVFAVNDNMIQSWDGHKSEGVGSKLTDWGWSQTLADGITAGPAAFGEYNAGGVRYVPAVNAAHTYKGKAWVGQRVAYLRSWGSPATNVYNLNVELEANKTYVFRGVSAWHNNENNPVFTYAINTAKSNLGDTLGIQSITCTVKQQGEDYGFEFTPTTSGTHYLTVSSNAINDAICGADYLAIYPKVQLSTVNNEVSNASISVYPTVSTGLVNIITKADGTIRLFDIAGKLIETRVIGSSVESMQLPSKGIFMLEVNAGNESKVVKVISVK